MTALHPNAQAFADFSAICETMMTPPTTDHEVYADMDFRNNLPKLKSILGSLNITPLATCRLRQWNTIFPSCGLYELTMQKGLVRLRIPEGWIETYDVESKADGWKGDLCEFREFTLEALHAAEVLEHTALLQLLMPDNYSLSFDDYLHDRHADFSVEVPNPPEREATVLGRLSLTNLDVRIAADPSGIRFSPSLADQMLVANAEAEVDAEIWRDYEPLVTVRIGQAVAIVAQWGKYLLEVMAVKAALSTA